VKRRTQALHEGLQNLIHGALALYFRSVRYTGSIPEGSVVVYISNHRNGALDGHFLKRRIPDSLFITNRELSPFIRYFAGEQVAVYRHPADPAQKEFNRCRLKQAVDLALEGKRIVIFPEGTSKLGPSLLPLKNGAAWILKELAASAGSIRCVPVGLHYERGYEFRSAVEVLIGPAQKVEAADTRDFNRLMDSIKRMLLEVTVNFPDREEQRRGELFADFVSHYRKDLSHRELCRLYAEKKIPEPLIGRFRTICSGLPHPACPPVIFQNGSAAEVLRGLVLTPIVMAAFLLNIISCCIAYGAAAKMADDDNVISLWRLLAGVPALLLQVITYAALLPYSLGPLGGLCSMGGYLLVTGIGIAGFHRWRTIVWKIRNHRLARAAGIRDFLDEIDRWQVKQTG
jgi:1-acyl-sn-glycerol-3-phosphate acyltransferase